MHTGNRRLMTIVYIWLIILASTTINVLSIQQFIQITFALKDSKSFIDKSQQHRNCCAECCTTSPRTTTSAAVPILNSALLRVGNSRGGCDKRIQSTHSSSVTTSNRNRSSLPQQLLSTQHGRRTACSLDRKSVV